MECWEWPSSSLQADRDTWHFCRLQKDRRCLAWVLNREFTRSWADIFKRVTLRLSQRLRPSQSALQNSASLPMPLGVAEHHLLGGAVAAPHLRSPQASASLRYQPTTMKMTMASTTLLRRNLLVALVAPEKHLHLRPELSLRRVSGRTIWCWAQLTCYRTHNKYFWGIQLWSMSF